MGFRVSVVDDQGATVDWGSIDYKLSVDGFRELEAHSLALTGTPVENRLGDLWSIFDFLNPGLLGTAKAFGGLCKRMASPEGGGHAPLRRLLEPPLGPARVSGRGSQRSSPLAPLESTLGTRKVT